MSIQNTGNLPANTHPPLAHDAQGCKVAVPNGTTHWRIQRFTGGRPRLMPGRFELDLTPEQLLEMCGPGQYRIEALDEYGKLLAEVARVVVGASPELSLEPIATLGVRPSATTSDTRVMLETIAQMSRAHSESLQSLANAQADWIKTLATAKQLPRNGIAPFAQPQLPTAAVTDSVEPEPWWTQLLKPETLVAASGLLRNVGTWFGIRQPSSEPTKRRNAASALAQIAEDFASTKSAGSSVAAGLDSRAIETAFHRAQRELNANTPIQPGNDAAKPSTEPSS